MLHVLKSQVDFEGQSRIYFKKAEVNPGFLWIISTSAQVLIGKE